MDSGRSKYQRRQGYTQSLDRRVDKWIETGRQVVDGVAGTRPGLRRTNGTRFSGKSFEKVGRWVGDKLDWFLEDEEGWLESWQSDSQESYPSTKKPLEAVSRRVAPQRTSPLSSRNPHENSEEDEWPEESSFRLARWQRRGKVNEIVDSEGVASTQGDSSQIARRPLPRSSRRRGS